MLILRTCTQTLRCSSEPDPPCGFSSSWLTQKSRLHISVTHQLQTSLPTNPYVQNVKQRWSKGTAVSGSIKIDLPIQAGIWHLWQKGRDKNLFLWRLPKATELPLLYPLGNTGLIHDTSHTLSSANSVLIQEMWYSGPLPISRNCMNIFRAH